MYQSTHVIGLTIHQRMQVAWLRLFQDIDERFSGELFTTLAIVANRHGMADREGRLYCPPNRDALRQQ